MNDLISIIVPVYKQKNEYLKRCIDSLIRQTYQNIEIIIVNDGMTKDNLSLIQDYISQYPNIDVIGDKNQGVSAARNKGITQARGAWLVFVDSDDYLDDDFCKIMLQKAHQYHCDLVTSSLVRVYPQKQEVIKCSENDFHINANEFLLKSLNVQNCIGYMWGKLWRAEPIKKHHIFVDESLVVAEDASFCIKALSYYQNTVIIPDALYYYRLNVNSVTKQFDSLYFDKYNQSMNTIMFQLQKQGLMNNHDIETNFYNFVTYHLLMICVNYCFHPHNGRHYLGQRRLLLDCLKSKIFEKSLKYSTYEDLSLSRKISLFVLKHKLFFVMSLICKVRHRQFR